MNEEAGLDRDPQSFIRQGPPFLVAALNCGRDEESVPIGLGAMPSGLGDQRSPSLCQMSSVNFSRQDRCVKLEKS